MNNNDNIYIFKKSWYELNPTLVDQTLPFDFNLVKLKNTGYIFLGTAIFAPFFINILISYLFEQNEYSIAIKNFINLVIVSIGSYFVVNGLQNKIIKSGAIAFYYFYFIPNIISLIIGIITSQFYSNNNLKTTINLITLIISGIVIIFTLFKTSPLVFKKIKITLKQDYKRIFLICIISIFFVFLVNSFFVYLQSLVTSSISNNQNVLIKAFDKWWNTIFLFIYSIIIAPIVEELATRHSIFNLSGNKWIGYISSTIFFSGMHVSLVGDWEYIIGYLGASLILGILFIIVNGNVTYTIITHIGYNFLAIILIFFKLNLFINIF